MNEEELIRRFQVFEQQIMQIQEQLQLVEGGIVELKNLDKGLAELVGKTGEEIMAQVGRGIFVKAKLLSEELLVDVGEKKFISKTIPETKIVLIEQIEKLGEVKEELENQLEDINKELTKVMMEAGPTANHCDCDDCDEECEHDGKECDCENGNEECKDCSCEKHKH
jgi:prefoldin alpha subunit